MAKGKKAYKRKAPNHHNNSHSRKRQNELNIQKVKTVKLAVMMFIILLAFAGLGVRLFVITRDNQNYYQKKILSQQRYDSTTLPFKRGTITDTNGTILAVSEKVYNVILDCKVMLNDEKSTEPTLSALSECFGLNRTELNQFVKENPNSQYRVLKKRITYDERKVFLDKQSEHNTEAAKKGNEDMGQINGVWFEEEYIRRYPNNTLACDVIGFTGTDNNGTYGLEEYYNDTLNGTNGREYGYLNDDATLERTTVPAVDGYSLVSTIDANIQAICEKYIRQFNDEHMNEAREGYGAYDIGLVIQNCNTGEIIAMASYPNFDLNDTKNTEALIGMQRLDKNGKKTGEIISEQMLEEIEKEGLTYLHLDALWKNFCISDTYEPGSTAKSMTLATGIETGRIQGNESYECGGALQVSDRKINCNVTSGHGTLDVSGALEQSCNVAFMKMGEAIGVKNLVQFENVFNIGLKTNIDLAGEARTASLVFTEDTMGPVELATSSFGQGYNVTMIEMSTAFCSIINGGYYYEPHVVNRITNANGDTVRNIEPRVLKQTISTSTSDQMRQYLYAAVAEGTGKSARPAGYAIGGKTGTAEKVPRDHQHYVVSFIGFAPADDPQIVIYCAINEPNVASQPHATYATGIVKNVLTEVLPYLHINKTEEMTIAEQEQVDNILGNIVQPDTPAAEGNGGDTGENSEGSENGGASENGEGSENGENAGEEDNKPAYVVDPDTGELIDAVTGEPAQMDYHFDGDDTGANTENTNDDAG